MADKLDINKPIARDLEGAKKKARKDYEDAQRQVEKDATAQKWSGKKGFGSVSDESATENKAHRDRAFHESQSWEQDGQELPKKSGKSSFQEEMSKMSDAINKDYKKSSGKEDNLTEWVPGRAYAGGGKVRGVGVALRGFGRGKIC